MTTIDHQQAVEAVQGAILGINVLTAERALTAAAPHLRAAWEQPIRELHRPVHAVFSWADGMVFYTYDDDNVSSKPDWVEYVVLRNYLEAHKPERCKANTTVLGSRLDCAKEAEHDGVHRFEDDDSGAVITWDGPDAV